MKSLKIASVLSILLLSLTVLQAKTTVTHLRCEWLENPIGLDAPHPRLSWRVETSRPGYLQAAYEIVVGANRAEIEAGKGSHWVTGTVAGTTIPLVYEGHPLAPFTRYYWKVRVRSADDSRWSEWSPIAYFETGMMELTNWRGTWIHDSPDYHIKPAPYFRKEFASSKEIVSARAYIAAAGYFELSINGERVGDHQLDPTYTRFDRRNLYVTHDVTDLLQQGKNAIGVLLGNGWYNHQSMAVWDFETAPWRARPKFCLDLRTTYADGRTKIITSGPDWKTALSPVIFNSIYTAEHYDARLEQAGWDRPGFDDKHWKSATPTGAPSPKITAQALHPVRHTRRIEAVHVRRLDERTWLYDFGRNMAGVSQLTVSGEAGTTIRLKHVERLNKEGRSDMSNIVRYHKPVDNTDPFQTDIFILSGKGEETFRPRFNYKGFQYVEVSADQPLELEASSLTAYFMHSDVPPAGHIHSSNDTLNKIWAAANASYLSNLFGYPTDCPQREKNGWTGDAHIAIETGLYNFEGITVYEKWLADHRDEQQPNGVLPAIIPTGGWGYHWANGPDWTSTIAIIPWQVYLFYGDSTLLEQCYPNIKRYVDHLDAISPSGLTSWGLGDWVPVKSRSIKGLTSSLYFYVDASILAKAAALLGKTGDQEKYTALAGKIRQAINAKYLDRETGIYANGLQTELSAALHWGVVPEDLRQKVADRLAERVRADGTQIDVGLLGSKTLLNALSENGHAQLAWELASRESYPSWGWWIVNGATTFYENWRIDAGRDISMNHIMFGEISAWYYKALGGIFPDEQNPGFKHVILKPHFVDGLDSFEAGHESPYGRIQSCWERAGETVRYAVSIPPNSTATLFLEGKVKQASGPTPAARPATPEKSRKAQEVYQLKSGRYLFEVNPIA